MMSSPSRRNCFSTWALARSSTSVSATSDAHSLAAVFETDDLNTKVASNAVRHVGLLVEVGNVLVLSHDQELDAGRADCNLATFLAVVIVSAAGSSMPGSGGSALEMREMGDGEVRTRVRRWPSLPPFNVGDVLGDGMTEARHHRVGRKVLVLEGAEVVQAAEVVREGLVEGYAGLVYLVNCDGSCCKRCEALLAQRGCGCGCL